MIYRKCFFAISIFLIIVPMVVAQETKGKIYTLTYSPLEPIVADDMTISVGVENTDSAAREYILDVVVIKDGRVKYKEKFTFKLNAGRGITFPPTYTPDDIGDHEIIAKLYDKFGVELLSTKLLKFNSISHIGPFDLEVAVPSDVVRPNTRIPIITQLVNMGEKGTDVEVKLTMDCIAKQDPIEKFILFLKPKESLKKVISIATCPEEGLHDVLGEIILFNRTWISSTSQIFINSSFIELVFDVPELFLIKPGESKVFDLAIKNYGNKIIHDLQVIIGTLPQAWIRINPVSVIEVEPGETAIFIINITVPEDAEETTYNFGISAAADETLTRKPTSLQVSGLAVAEKKPEIPPLIPEIRLPEISQNTIYLVAIPAGFIFSIVIINYISGVRFLRKRHLILNKLRHSTIESGRKGVKRV